jgi:hypothetical protein
MPPESQIRTRRKWALGAIGKQQLLLSGHIEFTLSEKKETYQSTTFFLPLNQGQFPRSDRHNPQTLASQVVSYFETMGGKCGDLGW